MKTKNVYLRGGSVFIVSLVVITLTVLIVYVAGINFNRSITENFYLSLAIIGFFLFIFITYGLYTGLKLINNFPKFKSFKRGEYIPVQGTLDTPEMDTGEGIAGFFLSLLLWIAMGIIMIIGLLLLEAVLWLSIFVILAMLYWIFFRALRLVFKKANMTKGRIGLSMLYAFTYSFIYLGWIFALVYISEQWS